MKRKMLILGLIGIVLLISVTATVFNNKEDLLSYFNTYKTNRETSKASDINKVSLTIEYLSKNCSIEYNSEKITCKICFTFEYNGTRSTCIKAREDLSQEEIDEKTRKKVNRKVITIYNQNNPIESLSYNDDSIVGRKITLE